MAIVIDSPPQTTRDWFWTVPLLTSAYDTVTGVYEGTKERNCLTRLTLGTLESSVKLAGRCASPFVNKLEKPISVADVYALKTLKSLEENYPVIKKPTGEVIETSKQVFMDALESSGKRIAGNPAVKLIGSGLSVGNSVLSSTISVGQRSVHSAGKVVGTGVDTCLDSAEAVVDYLLPEDEKKTTETELVVLPGSSDSSGTLRRRRARTERREQLKARRSHQPNSDSWHVRLERARDIGGVAMSRSVDRLSDSLETPIEQLESMAKMIRLAKAYNYLLELLDGTSEKVKLMNPFKAKQKKVLLLSDSDDEEEDDDEIKVSVFSKFETSACSARTYVSTGFNKTMSLPGAVLDRGCRLYTFTKNTVVDVATNLDLPSIPHWIYAHLTDPEMPSNLIDGTMTFTRQLRDRSMATVKYYLGYKDEELSSPPPPEEDEPESDDPPVSSFVVTVTQPPLHSPDDDVQSDPELVSEDDKVNSDDEDEEEAD